MRPPDGLGRCPCGFPADQLLYKGICIACVNRCPPCAGTGREQAWNWRTRSMGEVACHRCKGLGRRAA